jgi:hypothetical protein
MRGGFPTREQLEQLGIDGWLGGKMLVDELAANPDAGFLCGA